MFATRSLWLLALVASWWPAAGLQAAATLTIGTSNANPVAGGAAFAYTITISSDAIGATNVRMTFPLPTEALFQSLTLGGTAAGAFECDRPGIGVNGLVACEASQMLASSTATVTVVATFVDVSPGGARNAGARVVSDGAAASTASLAQTLANNAVVSQSSTDNPSGSLRVRRLVVLVTGSSASMAPVITETLPAGAYLAWIEPTGDLADSCSYDAVSGQLRCEPRYLRGDSVLTVLYGLPSRLFRNGFE